MRFLQNTPTATRNLIIINILMMVATYINEPFMIRTFGLFCIGSPYFRWWQTVTHMFMHGGFWHIFFNMYTLWIFGSVLENMWGTRKFLTFFFVTGLGAALLHLGVTSLEVSATKYIVPCVGASGAIYGLLLGYGMLFPDNILTLIFPPISLKAKWFVIIFAVIELATGLTGSDGVAHFAHLGGMLFGLLLISWWKHKGTLYYRS